MANTHELATTDYMNAQRVVQNCVLKNQSTVIEEMIRANLISEEHLYPFADDVMEWWLIDSWLAERLKEQGEVIIEEYGCYWWGRQSSGQAIYMDYVIQRICKGNRLIPLANLNPIIYFCRNNKIKARKPCSTT